MSKVGLEVVATLEATSAAVVPQSMRQIIVNDLGPIAERLDGYAEKAATVQVLNEKDAAYAAAICDQIAADVKAVKDHQLLAGIITGFHGLHKRLVGLRDAFVVPLEGSRKQIKGKVIAWQTEEQEKAAAEQRRLQAIAEEKARKEREALEKKAAAYKSDEKREAALEQAATVVAPVIQVFAPKSTLRVSRRWKVKSVDALELMKAACVDTNLGGYIEVKTAALERSKAANPSLTIPGVVFEQVTI